MRDRYDFIALGGGAGGLSASRAARAEGADVALISDGPLGGDCTFTGCVPSKTLIESARSGVGFAASMARVREVVAGIAATENAEVLRSEGIDVIEARGRFVGDKTIDVEGCPVSAPKIAICTGARASVPPITGLADVEYLTNHDLWDLNDQPASLGILGGGPIGCEMAQAFAAFGVDVTIFEMADRLLLREESEGSAIVASALVESGVSVLLGSPVTALAIGAGGGVDIHTAGHAPVTVERVLVALGRRANTEDLGLDVAGVALEDNGFIRTDNSLSTSAAGVWAVGDVNGKSPFTHAADEMGRIAAWNALRRFRRYRFDANWIPRVTFTDPEVAGVGVLEADAPADARVVELPMHANDRALTAGRAEGYIKLIVGPRRVLGNMGGGQILGASIVGQRAGELIHEPTLAMRTHMFAGRLAQTVHAYPTWSSGIQKAAGMLYYDIEGRSARPVRR